MKITQVSVFENADGYERARIPGIVCTQKGILVAYCELRQASDDWAVIDIGMKRSTDNGKTWSERIILVSGEGKNTVNNPLMIADGEALHFFYCVNYRQVFYKKSTDEGISWSQAKELTGEIKRQTGEFFWSCIATGPTHGICLSSGVLAVPLWLAYNKEDEASHHPSVIAVMYSVDKGESWSLGEINRSLTDPSEFSLAQLSCGKTVANIRHEGEHKCRAVGELTGDFSIENIYFAHNLPDPVCCAGFIALEDSFLFTNCASREDRIRLTIKRLTSDLSVVEELLLDESAGYSDIALSTDKKTAFVLFEKGRALELSKVGI